MRSVFSAGALVAQAVAQRLEFLFALLRTTTDQSLYTIYTNYSQLAPTSKRVNVARDSGCRNSCTPGS